MPTWRGNTYRFTVTAATAAAGDVYSNNGINFTVTDAIAGGTVLFCTGAGAPTATGNLVRVIGSGTNPIAFSAVTAPNTNWGTSTNWLTDGSGAGVPTSAGAGTDATFDNKSGDCTVNVAATCKNLTFNSGTGYTGTITMTNGINVGALSTANPSVTLSSGMNVLGTGAISTRASGTTTLTSNGYNWPNRLNINTLNLAASTVVLADNWSVGSLTVGPAGSTTIIFNGAFTITVNGDFAINLSSTTSRIIATAGAVSTIKLAGTGTWSQGAVVGVGINITIDAPTKTVTIANGCSFGGNGVSTSGCTLRYIAGTVITQGTFNLLQQPGVTAYTVNVNGASSPSATTTNTSGVNFNNLTIPTATGNSPQTLNITGNMCVIGTLTVGTSKINTPISGGTIYLNGNFTVNSFITSAPTAATFILQGTGTWSEVSTLTSLTVAFGIGHNVVINTTGTITLGSYVGIRIGSLTYTNGTVNYNGFGFRLLQTTITGFSSTGTIPYIMHSTNASGLPGNTGARLTINDSSPINVGTLVFENITVTNGFVHYGTAGWTVGTFLYQHIATTLNSVLRLLSGNTYRVTNSFTFLGRSTAQTLSSLIMIADGGTATFTLNPGASQNVYLIGATSIDSSGGQTVWSRRGVITSTTNWKNITDPVSIHKTYISN